MDHEYLSHIQDVIDVVRKTGHCNEREASIAAAIIVAEAIGQLSADLVNALDGIQARLEEIRAKLNDGGP